jgi:exodeoxyribonuclease V alpha subunit
MQTLDHTQTSETIFGSVHAVTYAGENGYAVIRVEVDPAFTGLPGVSRKGILTACGMLGHLSVGDAVNLTGSIETHDKYGPQFKVSKTEVRTPRSRAEISRYLMQVPYIGSYFASRIVAHFGEDTISILDGDPDRLDEVKGIGKGRLEGIKKTWAETAKDREVGVFLSSLGLSDKFATAVRICFKHCTPPEMMDLIRSNPYILAQKVRGIGFTRADEVAQRLGIPLTSEFRVIAAIHHTLSESLYGEGHCFLYEVELVQQTIALLATPEISKGFVEASVAAAAREKVVHVEAHRVYLMETYQAECDVAAGIRTYCAQPPDSRVAGNVEALVVQAVAANNLELDPAQLDAVKACLGKRMSVVTGGPGCGKTTLLKIMVKAYDLAGMPITLMAPTGRAAKRMTEVIGKPAGTVHMTLASLRPSPDSPPTLLEGVVFIDESSMLDIMMMAWILRNTSASATIILIGDKDQLPSVGPGALLRDMLESPMVTVSRLTKIFRQAADSKIIRNSHGINTGNLPFPQRLSNRTFDPAVTPHLDFHTIYADEAADLANHVCWLISRFIPSIGHNPMTDVQVIAPQRNGAVGVNVLNHRLQHLLNPTPVDYFSPIHGADTVWAIGDRLMQTANNYKLGICNGDLGILKDIVREDNGNVSAVAVDFDGKVVLIPKNLTGDITLAYATTVHKCQGSEFPVVVCVLHTSHYMLLQRNLLYTAVTRGKQRVFLVVSADALSRALANNTIIKRNTYLQERLAG